MKIHFFSIFVIVLLIGCEHGPPATTRSTGSQIATIPPTDLGKFAHEDWANLISQLDSSTVTGDKEFASLATSKVPSRENAQHLGLDYWFHKRGLLAEERVDIYGLYRVGRDIPGFAVRGDWLWELRVTHIFRSFDGVIWINARTGIICDSPSLPAEMPGIH